jgi:hypothetical protein
MGSPKTAMRMNPAGPSVGISLGKESLLQAKLDEQKAKSSMVVNETTTRP